MSQPAVVKVKQLRNRLENATASERIDVIVELQTLSRTEASLVGEIALQKVLDFLKEQGSAEEYQESLDLIDRLIKVRDRVAASANTEIILSNNGNVELLLDLLEHEDLTVGVMASQLLTEVHAIAPLKLESCIQDCPDGMNKLLQRLPDRNREEVSNQAIVLVQQLTVLNEEMKKTVVFNEGFEILFGIIRSEGGCADSGIVVQDCLRICSNILSGSEICQRFFFGMGKEWVLNLHQFFDPLQVENVKVDNSLNQNSEDFEEGAWFENPVRVGCATLALKAIAGALEVVNAKHQKVVACQTGAVSSAAFWVARKGPDELLEAALQLLARVVESNSEVAAHVADIMVEVSPSISGRSYPLGGEVPAIYFGWRPLPTDDRRFITVPALLSERYIFTSTAWTAPSAMQSDGGVVRAITVKDGLSLQCLHVLETLLRADPTTCDMLIQYILAPPPPSARDEDLARGEAAALETIRPLGAILLTTLLDGSGRFLGGNVANAVNVDVSVVERSANVLTLLFLGGGQLARELSTVISTAHTGLSGKAVPQNGSQPLLPFLLATAGKAARIPGAGHVLLVSLLRLLSTIVGGCDVAARQLLEDPSNFFVVDLATTMSESAGVPVTVQVAACFFLGSCFTALKDVPQTEGAQEDQSNHLTQRSFLSMVDSRIGLTRFVEMLRRPLTASRNSHGSATKLPSELFFSLGFKAYYELQVEGIRKGIFDLYSGGNKGGGSAEECSLREIVEMQKEKIQELEEKISTFSITGTYDADTVRTDVRSEELSTEIKELSLKIVQLEECLASLEAQKKESEVAANLAHEQMLEHERNLTISRSKILLLEEELVARSDDLEGMLRGEAAITAEADSLRKRAEGAEKTIRQYESQLQNKSKTGEFSNVDLKQLMDRIESLSIRAEGNEKYKMISNGTNAHNGDHSDRNSDDNENSQKAEFEQTIVALKESILQLDTERDALQNLLTQREKKIELLEEDLRGPVPYEMGREKRIVDLESRNAELKQQLWLAESEMESNRLQSPCAPVDLLLTESSPSGTNIGVRVDENTFAELVRTALHLLAALGIDPSAELSERISDPALSPSEHTHDIVRAMQSCQYSITSAVSCVGDMVRTMGLTDFASPEGSVERLSECLSAMDKEHSKVKQKVARNDQLSEELVGLREHYSSLIEEMHTQHVEELALISSQNQTNPGVVVDGNSAGLRELESAAAESKKECATLKEKLNRLTDELEFHKNENLDSVMKKEIVIINQTSQIAKLTNSNKDLASALEKAKIEQDLNVTELLQLRTSIEDMRVNETLLLESNGMKLEKEKQENRVKEEEEEELRVKELQGEEERVRERKTADEKKQEEEQEQRRVRDLENQAVRDQMQNRIDELCVHITNANTEIGILNTEIVQLQTDLSNTLENTAKDKAVISSATSLQNEKYEHEIEALKEVTTEHMAVITKQLTLLHASDEKLSTVQEEMKDLVTSLLKLEAGKEEETSEMQQHIEQLSDDILELQEKCNALKDETFVLKSNLQNEKLKSFNLENKQITDELNAVSTAVGGSESEDIRTLKSELQLASEMINKLTAELSESKEAKNEVDELRKSGKQLESNVGEMEGQLRTAVVTALTNEITAKTEIEALEFEKIHLQQKIVELGASLKEQSELLESLQSSSTSLTGAEGEGEGEVGVIELEMEGGEREREGGEGDVSGTIENGNETKHTSNGADISISVEHDKGKDEDEEEEQNAHANNSNDNDARVQDLGLKILDLECKVQDLSLALAEKESEYGNQSTQLTDALAEVEFMRNENESNRMEYQQKDDLILEIVEAKHSLEVEIQTFLDESCTIKEELETSLEQNRIREGDLQRMGEKLLSAELLIKENNERIEHLLSERSASRTELDQTIAREKEEKEKLNYLAIQNGINEKKEKEERDAKADESRNFYAVRIFKIQENHANQVEKLEEEINNLKEQLINGNKADLDAVQDVEIFTAENANLEKELRNDTLSSDHENDTSSQLLHAQQKIETLSTRIEELTMEIDSINDGRQMLQSQKNVLQDENDILTHLVAQHDQEKNVLQELKKNLEVRIALECDERTSNDEELEKQLKNVQEELQAAKVEKENLMEEYSLAKKEHAEKEGNFLTAQEGLTQDISALKEAISQAEKTIESLQSSLSTTSTSLEESKVQVLSLCGERDALQKQLGVVSAEMMGDSKAAIATLQNEITKLSSEIMQRTVDLQQKDSDVHRMNSQLLKREGEMAGIRSSIVSMEEELSALRVDNDALEKQSSLESRKSKDLSREVESLKSKLSIETDEVRNLMLKNEILEGARSQSQSRTTTPSKNLPSPSSNGSHSLNNTDAIDLSTARLALNEVIIWLESKSTVQDSTSASFKSPKKSLKSSSSENVPSASRVSFRDSVYNEETVCALVERTKVAASTVIADRERLLSKQCAKLSELEKQLQESLLRGLIESGTQPRSPYATTTPVRTNIVSAVLSNSQPSSGSSASKEAARLHLALTQERHRHSDLNEQHSDLLGLLAQQEIELDVFRAVLNTQCGEAAVIKAENKSKLAAIEAYGTYTTCRPNGGNLDRSGLYLTNSP